MMLTCKYILIIIVLQRYINKQKGGINLLGLTKKQAEILDKMRKLDPYKMALLCNTAEVLSLVQEREKEEKKKLI